MLFSHIVDSRFCTLSATSIRSPKDLLRGDDESELCVAESGTVVPGNGEEVVDA